MVEFGCRVNKNWKSGIFFAVGYYYYIMDSVDFSASRFQGVMLLVATSSVRHYRYVRVPGLTRFSVFFFFQHETEFRISFSIASPFLSLFLSSLQLLSSILLQMSNRMSVRPALPSTRVEDISQGESRMLRIILGSLTKRLIEQSRVGRSHCVGLALRIRWTLVGSVQCFQTASTRPFSAVETIVLLHISVRNTTARLFWWDHDLARGEMCLCLICRSYLKPASFKTTCAEGHCSFPPADSTPSGLLGVRLTHIHWYVPEDVKLLNPCIPKR